MPFFVPDPTIWVSIDSPKLGYDIYLHTYLGIHITIPWIVGASRGGPKGRFCEFFEKTNKTSFQHVSARSDKITVAEQSDHQQEEELHCSRLSTAAGAVSSKNELTKQTISQLLEDMDITPCVTLNP